MRLNLFRGALALVVALTFASPTLAQSVVRGKVVDAQGKPVTDATVVFEATEANRKIQTKSNKNGEFMQIGLQSGAYTITASKDGVGADVATATIRQGQNPEMTFTLSRAGGGTPADREAAAALQAAAGGALEALKAGRNDEAITKFNEVLVKLPNCSDCYYNLGVAYSNKQQFDQAEQAFKKVIEIKPDSGEAYTGLANIYNAQKKFDLATTAGAKAAELSGGAGGAGAEVSYNQGVVLFNSGKFAEAKVQFEAATKADPNMAMAHYQLGMANLNTGDIPGAVAALEQYLKVDPNGAKAAEVKTSLPALQGMLKK